MIVIDVVRRPLQRPIRRRSPTLPAERRRRMAFYAVVNDWGWSAAATGGKGGGNSHGWGRNHGAVVIVVDGKCTSIL